jgi:hypothetical protein
MTRSQLAFAVFLGLMCWGVIGWAVFAAITWLA